MAAYMMTPDLMRRLIVHFCFALLFATGVTGVARAAQAQTGTMRVEVVSAEGPVAGATVTAAGHSGTTDANGLVTLTLPAGRSAVVITKPGFESATGWASIVAGRQSTARFPIADLAQGPVVESTRSLRRLDNQAVPIDLIERDVFDRKALGSPADIASALDYVHGLRTQITSPTLGTSIIRMRGLFGRYTRLLSDGAPLYGDRPLGLIPVQIPVLGLERIELMKGTQSAFYGADSPAGTLNLISRVPGLTRAGELLVSQSSRGGSDVNFWWSTPANAAGLAGAPVTANRTFAATFLVSAHRQEETDVNDDGWSDLPRVERLVARPRVYWTNHRGRSIVGVAGVTYEKRAGGSSISRESFDSKSADGSMSGEMILKSGKVLAGNGVLFAKSRTRDLGDSIERDRQQTAAIDLNLRSHTARNTWVAGMSIEWYGLRSIDALPSSYISTRGGLFFHDDMTINERLVVSGSARVDHHNRFGIRFNPRGSMLIRGGRWTARVSAGVGYYNPLFLNEATEAAGVIRLNHNGLPDIERVRDVSVDVSHRTPTSRLTLSLFNSQIKNPALIDRATYTLRNVAAPIDTRGLEVIGSVRKALTSEAGAKATAYVTIAGSYAFVHPRHQGRDVPLTPRRTGNLVVMAESTRRGRVGLDISFTGKQLLDANPFRTISEPYTLVGLFAEYRFGKYGVFVNGSNLRNIRQTNWDPIARPTRDVDGRWTVDAWAPLSGRVINGGLRVVF